MATAHPAKFGNAIDEAIPGHNLDMPQRLKVALDQDESYEVLPENYQNIKQFILANVN